MGEGTADAANKEHKALRKRLAYLKTRSRELKKELQSVREEGQALRDKLGLSAKSKKEGKTATASD
jgi:predicted  nucleic acid-binding Zn-ribbon protein